MDSNSDNLAQTNMTRNTSLTSLESGFVSLNELKTKEQMAVEIDSISNKIEEKKKEVLDQLSFINQQQQRVSYLTIQNLLVGNISNFSLYTNYDSILLLFCQLLV
uniref:Uncharacterized protein n=1 Tax=Meloidogyne floridensis TaxID=298350 RepID=A0A915PBM9_9BILA